MSLIDFDKKPSRHELLWFGMLLPPFVAAVGAAQRWLWGMPRAAVAIWSVGAAVSAVFALVPAARRPIYRAWMLAVFPIGWTVSHLLLAAVFYLVLTPIGLVLKLAGKDPLRREFERDAASYWIAKDAEIEPSRYFRQF